MTKQVNVGEAKAKLSQLLDEAIAGEEITIARAGRPVARLVAVDAAPPRLLGFLPLDIDDAFFDELDDEELEAWG